MDRRLFFRMLVGGVATGIAYLISPVRFAAQREIRKVMVYGWVYGQQVSMRIVNTWGHVWNKRDDQIG